MNGEEASSMNKYSNISLFVLQKITSGSKHEPVLLVGGACKLRSLLLKAAGFGSGFVCSPVDRLQVKRTAGNTWKRDESLF